MSNAIAILGCGSLGEAMLAGFLAAGIDSSNLIATVRSGDRAERIARLHRIRVTALAEDPETNKRAVAGAGLVILGVKPGEIIAMARDISPVLPQEAIVISIAAGVATNQLEAVLPFGQPVVRAMPNAPTKIRHGITALVAGAHCAPEHLRYVKELLAATGKVVEVREADLDAVTAISGSGPAYIFYLTEALAGAGTQLGLSSDLSARVAREAIAGAGLMLAEASGSSAAASGESEAAAAGLIALDSTPFQDIVADAMRAAASRSAEISQENELH